ncbi:MAG: class A beta-lactamase [Pseudomonadota bacterium]
MKAFRPLVLVVITLVTVTVLTLARAGDDRSVVLSQAIAAQENALDNRIGAFVLDTSTGRLFGYRADERFAMASAFKILLAGAVLARIDAGDFTLDTTLPMAGVEIQPHSPVTGKLDKEAHISIASLCQAAVETSDNTATNMLLDLLGGPGAFTADMRRLGDAVTRIDRRELALNSNIPGDPRDTSTPAAMATSLAAFLQPGTLSTVHRHQLISWLQGSVTGKARLRAGLPKDWQVGDKTGTGRNGAVNDVAVAWPSDESPLIVVVLMDGGKADVAAHNAAHAAIGGAVTAWMTQLEGEQQLSDSVGVDQHAEALRR